MALTVQRSPSMATPTVRHTLGSLVFTLALTGCSSTTGALPTPATDAAVTADSTPAPATDAAVTADSTPTPDVFSTADSAVDAAVPTDVVTPTDSPPADGAVDAGALNSWCGGDTPIPEHCAPGLFCDYPLAAECGATDGPGMCHIVPSTCAPDNTPVCGCDGVTYASRCVAARAGSGVLHLGACVPPDCHLVGCPDGGVCSECRSSAGITWVCLPTGSAC